MALQVDLLEQRSGGVAAQEEPLLAALALVMEHLRQPEALALVLNHLGERQFAVDMTPGCCEIGGEALRETLRLTLGEQWTPALQDAWAATSGALVTLMLDGEPDETPAAVSDS